MKHCKTWKGGGACHKSLGSSGLWAELTAKNNPNTFVVPGSETAGQGAPTSFLPEPLRHR
jgi:hypothetical protein